MELDKLRSGTVLVLLGKVFMGGAGLVVTMLLTRLVGTAEVGAYFMMAQVVNVARLFSEAGMNVGLQKLIGVGLAEGDDGAIRRHTLAAAAVMALTLTLIGGLLVVFWRPLTVELLGAAALGGWALLAIPWLFGFSVEDMSSVFFRSLHEIKTAVLGVGVPRQLLLVTVLGVAWLIEAPVDLEGVIFLVAGSWAFSGLVSAGLVAWRLRRINAPAAGGQIAGMQRVLTLSLPMLLHTGALLVMNSADVWVLQIARGSAEVGIYGSVAKVSVSMAFFVGAVNMVLPPMLARLYKDGRMAEMEELLRRSAAWGAYLAVPMALAFSLGGVPILSLAFTPDYAAGAAALATLAIAHCINALSGSPGYALQMTGSHIFLMRLTVAVATLNLVGNIALVGPLGMNGVALSTAFCLILQNVVMVIVVKRRIGIKTWVKLPGS